MDFLKNLFEIISKFTFKDWLIVVLSVIILALYASFKHARAQADNVEYIYRDSIYKYKNKVDEDYAAINLYVQKISELKGRNDELRSEIKNLKDNPFVVTNVVTNTIIKDVPTKSDSITQHTDTAGTAVWNTLHWSAREPAGHYSLKGSTDVMSDFSAFSTRIGEISVPAKFTFDIVEGKKDGQLRFIAKSSNPYVIVQDMDGVVLDPSKIKTLKKSFPQKRFHIGPSFGYYLTSDMKLRPALGLGISYSIISF